MLRKIENFVTLVVCLLTVAPTSNAQITLAEETANNTSACTLDNQHPYCASAFRGLMDGNDGTNGDPIETIYPDPAPAHVTSVSLSSTAAPTLMYSGFNGKFICEYQPWFGLSSHLNVGYSETNSQTTDAQAAAMSATGCNIALVSFYGTDQLHDTDYAFDLQATGTLFTSVGRVSGLKFGIMEVDQAFSGTDTQQDHTGNCNRFGPNDPADTVTCIEGALENDLEYINTNYVSTSYWTDGSPAKPVMAFFGSVCDFAALSYGDPPADCHAQGPGPNAVQNWNNIGLLCKVRTQASSSSSNMAPSVAHQVHLGNSPGRSLPCGTIMGGTIRKDRSIGGAILTGSPAQTATSRISTRLALATPRI